MEQELITARAKEIGDRHAFPTINGTMNFCTGMTYRQWLWGKLIISGRTEGECKVRIELVLDQQARYELEQEESK